MKKRALITGETGFAGRYLSDYLNSKGYEVWGLDVVSYPEQSEQNIVIRTADISNNEQIEAVLAECQPDVIYHLAAQSSVAVSWQNPQATMRINLEGTINLLETVRKLKLDSSILLIGSGEEYGAIKPEDLPIDENQHPNPQNPYALSKLYQTLLGLHYMRVYNMKIYLARPFNHTGPGQNTGFVIPDFASQIAKVEAGLQDPVIWVGNLSAKRDFCDVRDVVRAYYSIMEKGQIGRIYNIASGQAVPIQSILDQLLSLSTVPIEVKIDQKKFRPADVPVIYSSISRIKAETGWEPQIKLYDTLKDTLEFWRTQVNKEKQ